MDKFGIFNLLSSFFSQNTFSQNSNGSANNAFSPLIGNLLSSLSANNPNSSTQNQVSVQPTQIPPSADTQSNLSTKMVDKPPLQYQMLQTMQNHDRFVKKVKNTNPTYKI